jgi:hypothetical protein
VFVITVNVVIAAKTAIRHLLIPRRVVGNGNNTYTATTKVVE